MTNPIFPLWAAIEPLYNVRSPYLLPMDVQILLPVKGTQSGTAAVNAAIQSIYNPKSTTKKEIHAIDEVGVSGVFREGDG